MKTVTKNEAYALKLLSDLNMTRYTERHIREIEEFLESGSNKVRHLLGQLGDYDETDVIIANQWIDKIIYENNHATDH